jgi:hypothetical protein
LITHAKIGAFFKEKGWKYIVSETDNPYTYAHKLKDGMTLWQHIDKFPDRLKNVNYTMVAQNSATSWTVGIFPFGAELNKIHTEDDTVLLVDVGGGMGQATRQIKQMCSNIKGRMVLQDRKEVTSTITENMPGIEVCCSSPHFVITLNLTATTSLAVTFPLVDVNSLVATTSLHVQDPYYRYP